jgi:hypothetical protein
MNLTWIIFFVFMFALGLGISVGFWMAYTKLKTIVQPRGYKLVGKTRPKEIERFFKTIEAMSISEIELVLHFIMSRPCKIVKSYSGNKAMIDAVYFMGLDERQENEANPYHDEKGQEKIF